MRHLLSVGGREYVGSTGPLDKGAEGRTSWLCAAQSGSGDARRSTILIYEYEWLILVLDMHPSSSLQIR